MGKQPRVWDGSQWQELAVTLPDLSNYSTTTQMNTAIGANAGLNLISSTSFSASSAVNINNCFTSTYTSYRIMLDISSVSAWSVTYLRLRANGTDDSSSNYRYGFGIAKDNSTGTYFGSSGTNVFSVANANATYPTIGQVDIIAPQAARYTTMNFQYMGGDNVNWFSAAGGGQLTTSTQYDGFTIYPNSGNITGTVRVYGYRNS